MGLLDRLATTLGGGEDIADEPRAEVERALAFGATGDWLGAEAILAAAAERHRVPALYVALGEARVRLGRDEQAVQAFGQAVDLSAYAVDGWLGLGEALVRLGRYEPAREALRKVLARTGESGRRARAYAARGRIALGLDEPARAVRELREAASLLPHDYAIAHDLGRALGQQHDPEASSWLARAAHAPTPQPEWVLDAAAAAPTPAAAQALLQSGLDVVGEDRPAARAALEAALAQILARAGDATGAGALAVAAIGHAPGAPLGEEALSVVHELAGELDLALKAAERAVTAGGALDLPRLLRLALAARDQAACLRVAARAAPDDPLAQAARAFAAGTASDDELIRLGLLGGEVEARRFVAAAASPGPVPEGNLYALLTYARALATSVPALAPLVPATARAVEAFDRPLLVAVMGEFNAGKSSFVNALVGEKVAEVGVTPTTATINVLRYGPSGGRVLYHDGRAEELQQSALAGFFATLDDARAAAIRMVEIFVPLELLRRVEVVDTPGLNSLRPEHEAIARGFLTDADAIVWLFAVGQVAKATERDALALARAAGKRVLGVLNKADQASAEEIAEIERHVQSSLGELIEALRPLSARQAMRWHRVAPAERAGADDGGLGAVVAALEERFFAQARALKRTTALHALGRFVKEATALTAAAPVGPALPPDGVALEAREETLRGAVATARLATKARLEAGFRQAAAELHELFEHRPSRLLGERTSSPEEDRRFLHELLEDVVFEATAAAARELEGAAAGGPAVPIERLIDRFRAYARGIFRGGLADQLLRRDQPGLIRTDATKLARTLLAAIPDVESELFTPLAAAIGAAYAAARAEFEARGRERELVALIREARVGQPLAALAEAVLRA